MWDLGKGSGSVHATHHGVREKARCFQSEAAKARECLEPLVLGFGLIIV